MLLFGLIAFISTCLSEAQRCYIVQPTHIYTCTANSTFYCYTVCLFNVAVGESACWLTDGGTSDDKQI